MVIRCFRMMIISLMLVSGAVATPAQQPASPRDPNKPVQSLDPEKDAWRYVVESQDTRAARRAGLAARKLLENLPDGTRQAIMSTEFLNDQILLALKLADERLMRARALRSPKALAEIAVYHDLVQYAALSINSIVENRFNQREIKMLSKQFEITLRDQIAALEELCNQLMDTESSQLEPVLFATRRSRIEALNRVLGSQLIALPDNTPRLQAD